MWIQTTLNLRPQPRGFHLVTDEIVASLPDLAKFEVGLLHRAAAARRTSLINSATRLSSALPLNVRVPAYATHFSADPASAPRAAPVPPRSAVRVTR